MDERRGGCGCTYIVDGGREEENDTSEVNEEDSS